MKLFRSKLEVTKDEIDYKKMNELPAEAKIMISQTQQLIDNTQNELKAKGVMIDLTCKRQLQDDCKLAEKVIVKLSKCNGKKLDTLLKELEIAKIRLETTSTNILGD